MLRTSFRFCNGMQYKWQSYPGKPCPRPDPGIRKARECIITPATYNVTAWSRWQIHKCVGSGLCCSEKFWKFLTREEPKPKTAVLPVSWAQHTGKFFNQTSSTDGKCTLRRCAFWRSLNNLKRRVPNPKKIRVPETDFIHSSDVEIFAEFTCEITFEIRAKVAAPENSMCGRFQDKRKRLAYRQKKNSF